MISEKDYNEIYLKGCEYGKNDKNNLKITYEIKPSFTTRKLKNLEQQCKKQKEVIDKLELENKVLKEQMVAMVKPNYTYGVR